MTVAVESRSRADHAPLVERAFALEPEEGSGLIESIEGEIPDFVRGTYYLNGPARFSRGGRRYEHWLDGDGMVTALEFSSTGVRHTSRLVRSTKLTAEEGSGRALYRGFGTAFAGDRLKRGIGLESPVNVSVYPFAGSLLAFGEQGLPWELDPQTLETRGECTFGGRLNDLSPFAAHPKFDPETGEMFNFGVSFSPRRPAIHLYRFAADGTPAYRRRLSIERPVSMHDFGLSPHYAAFYVSPHVLRTEDLVSGGAALVDALDWRPELGSRLLVAERESGRLAASIPIGSGYCLHLVDCFEENGLLMVDVVELERPVYDQYDIGALFTDVRHSRPMRYAVDVDAGQLVGRVGFDFGLMSDFPTIDPRRRELGSRDFWVLSIAASERPGRKFFDRVTRVDWQGGEADHWQAPPLHYLGGEPVFVPDPRHERAGAVLCQQFNAREEQSEFLVFDAFDLAAGPSARLRLERPMRLGFHACFAPAAEGGERGAVA